MFDARIDNRHQLDSPPSEFFTERFRIWKTRRIEREHAIPEHVIDIEMNHVQRQIVFAILPRDFFDHRVGIVAPAALLIAQCPHRRQWHVTGQIRVAAENLFDRWAIEEVVVELTAFRAKPDPLLRRMAEVEVAAITVVEKDPVRGAALQADIERNGLIDRILAFGVAGRVGIPVHEEAAPFVEAGGFFAEAIEVFVKAEFFRNGDESTCFGIELHSRQLGVRVVGHRAFVGIDWLVRACVAKLDQERRMENDYFKFVGADSSRAAD